ncbi:MAG: hypothetical protein RLZ28_1242 [Actinomycetota bacterium]|jgi:anthranilate/para-aminobenzoate synthase component I
MQTGLKLFAHKFQGWVAPADCFAAFFADSTQAFWFDRQAHPTDRFSVIGEADTVHEFKFETDGLSQLAALQSDFEQAAGTSPDLDLPFEWRPGVVFALAYDPETVSRAMTVTKGIAFDHEKRQMWFVGFFESQKAFDRWFHSALLTLTLTGGNAVSYRFERRTKRGLLNLTVRHSDEEYLQLIRASQVEIVAGNAYQICLTNQLSATHDLDPLDVFLRLRETNPAPYSAYLRFDDFSLASASVEQFLTANRDGRLQTKPIKGTRARSTQELAVSDQQIADELASNVKERAENLMIVDLMRNDLAIVCDADSVTVTELFEVQSYPTLHQLVSTIEGQLRPQLSHVDALTAMFPGGSMTGAPKFSAINIIKRLEGGPRGIYSGVFGYLGHFGHTDVAMVIRSIVFEGNQLSIGIGGGITSDSDPIAELAETKLKARALLAALEVPDAW